MPQTPIKGELVNSSALRVLTANLSFHNQKTKETTCTILSCNPDVIVLLEWTGVNFDSEEATQKGRLALVNSPQPCLADNPKNGAYGIGIFVRLPFAQEGCVVPSPVKGPSPLPLGTARIRYQHRDITVIGLHAPAPISEWTTKPTIRKAIEPISKGTLTEDFGAGQAGDGVILTGDFNVPSFDPILREVKQRGLIDAYSVPNRKPGPTWAPFACFPTLLNFYTAIYGDRFMREQTFNGLNPKITKFSKGAASALGSILSRFPPLLRLDYIFCSKEFRVLKSWTMKTPGSDHRTVVADLTLKES
jgi:endonuclease/exonuclease/phosphatase (EEP) superfamily protein YafD